MKILDRSNNSMNYKICIGVVSVISLIFFYSYTYGDIVSTARMGITLWDNVFSGTIREFYRDRVYMTITAYAQDMWATYDFPIYIIFAIWNFPLWLLEHFAGVDVLNNALCMMWTKTMLLPFIYFLIQALYRVCTALKMEEEKANGEKRAGLDLDARNPLHALQAEHDGVSADEGDKSYA